MKTFAVTNIAIVLVLLGNSVLANEPPKMNDPTIGKLPQLTQALRLDAYTDDVLNLMIRNSLSYKAFLETFHLFPRVDMTFITKVREDVTRYIIVGKDYDGGVLRGCVQWEISHHLPKPDSDFAESDGNVVSRTDCTVYENWEKFIDLRK